MHTATFRLGQSVVRGSLWLTLVMMSCGLVVTTVPAASARASTPSGASGKAVIGHARCARSSGASFRSFAFSPRTVDEGGTADLSETIANCSAHTFVGSVQTFGKDVCLIVDPVQQHITLGRHQSVTLTSAYAVPACTGTGTITGQLLSHSGRTLDTRMASFRSVVPPPAPTIVADPASVMANTATNLTGTHFPANATLTIKECSQSTWIVVENPCVSSNVITVTTNSGGGFAATLTAEVCPSPTATPPVSPGFVESCYVGQPHPQGIDTMTLAGAAPITVTGP